MAFDFHDQPFLQKLTSETNQPDSSETKVKSFLWTPDLVNEWHQRYFTKTLDPLQSCGYSFGYNIYINIKNFSNINIRNEFNLYSETYGKNESIFSSDILGKSFGVSFKNVNYFKDDVVRYQDLFNQDTSLKEILVFITTSKQLTYKYEFFISSNPNTNYIILSNVNIHDLISKLPKNINYQVSDNSLCIKNINPTIFYILYKELPLFPSYKDVYDIDVDYLYYFLENEPELALEYINTYQDEYPRFLELTVNEPGYSLINLSKGFEYIEYINKNMTGFQLTDEPDTYDERILLLMYIALAHLRSGSESGLTEDQLKILMNTLFIMSNYASSEEKRKEIQNLVNRFYNILIGLPFDKTLPFDIILNLDTLVKIGKMMK